MTKANTFSSQYVVQALYLRLLSFNFERSVILFRCYIFLPTLTKTFTSLVGLDLAKNVFQVHGVDEAGRVVLRKKLSRKELVVFMNQLKPCLVGLEACGGAHFWKRKFELMGHTVKLMAPQYVKPYVKSNKNDMSDAEAICEAVTRPNMPFVPAKSKEQQDVQCLHRIRQGWIAERTALVNRIRGMLAEYGVVVAKSVGKLRSALPEILADDTNELSSFGRELFGELYLEVLHLDEKIAGCDLKIGRIFRQNQKAQRLAKIEGIGPITSTALLAAVSDARVFKNGRQMSAWLGLVPKQHSSGGKNILMGISKRGDVYLRTLLIHGARAVLKYAESKTDPRSLWIQELIKRKGVHKASVAVANKNARIAWVLLANEEEYKKAS
jgi:transposase